MKLLASKKVNIALRRLEVNNNNDNNNNNNDEVNYTSLHALLK